MVSVDDYLLFLDEVLDDMVRIVTELGDELANQRPDLPDSNSPYAILTHCLGVMEYWGGYMVGGRSIQRDRAAEFRAAAIPCTEEILMIDPLLCGNMYASAACVKYCVPIMLTRKHLSHSSSVTLAASCHAVIHAALFTSTSMRPSFSPTIFTAPST